MLKTLDILLVCALLAAASWTYKIKHDAGLIEAELAKVEREIDLERETIALLEADWSLLDQPDRLQRIAEAFAGVLELEPTKPDQIVDLAGLPGPPPLPEPVEGEDPVAAAIMASAAPQRGAR